MPEFWLYGDEFVNDSSLNYDDRVTEGAVRVLRAAGLPGLTARAIAVAMRVTPSALSQHYPTRTHMFQAIGDGLQRRWLAWFRLQVFGRDLHGLFPGDAVACSNIKAWLAFCELARTSEAVAQVVANTRAAEVDELQDMLTYRGVTDHPDLELVRATIHGLHAALCEASDPMSAERARQLLDELLPRTLYSRSN